MNELTLQVIAIFSLMILPVWTLWRAHTQRSYKAVLFIVLLITCGAFYVLLFSGYISEQTTALYLAMAATYGAITLVITVVVMFFAYKGVGEAGEYIAEAMAQSGRDDDKDENGPGYGAGHRPGDGYGYGHWPGQGYGHGGTKTF